ncbi:unnamed protein product, partial [Polarella glacialis]
ETGDPHFGQALGRLLLGGEEDEPEITGFAWLPTAAAQREHVGYSSASQMPAAAASPPARAEETSLAAEVQRIRPIVKLRNCPADDFNAIFGIPPHQEPDLQVVQSRYRQLMRLLHPDKRGLHAQTESLSLHACDEAFEMVQKALEVAKKEIEAGPDPSKIAMQSMRRMQEMQRERTRQAAHRQHEAEVGSLVADVERALASASNTWPPAAPEVPASDLTAQQIMGLLAQLGGQ